VTICYRCTLTRRPPAQYELCCSPGVSSFRSSSLFCATRRSSCRSDAAPRSRWVSSSSSSINRPPVHQLLSQQPQAVNQRLRARHRRRSSRQWSSSFLASSCAGCLSSSCSSCGTADCSHSATRLCHIPSARSLSSTPVPIRLSMLHSCTLHVRPLELRPAVIQLHDFVLWNCGLQSFSYTTVLFSVSSIAFLNPCANPFIYAAFMYPSCSSCGTAACSHSATRLCCSPSARSLSSTPVPIRSSMLHSCTRSLQPSALTRSVDWWGAEKIRSKISRYNTSEPQTKTKVINVSRRLCRNYRLRYLQTLIQNLLSRNQDLRS